MPIQLSSVLDELEYPFQMLHLLRDRRCRDFLTKVVLNELLSVLISNFLHINISYARGEISHDLRRFFEGTIANLSLCAYKTILKEVRQPH